VTTLMCYHVALCLAVACHRCVLAPACATSPCSSPAACATSPVAKPSSPHEPCCRAPCGCMYHLAVPLGHMRCIAVLLAPAYSASVFFFFLFLLTSSFVVQSPQSLTILFADGRTAMLFLQGLPQPNHRLQWQWHDGDDMQQ